MLSTVDDIHRFGAMLLAGGTPLLSEGSVAAMTTDHLGIRAGVPGPSDDGTQGWGLGVGVQVRAAGPAPARSYGWAGGLGSSWWNDPATGTVAVILTTDSFGPDGIPAIIADFAEVVSGTVPPAR